MVNALSSYDGAKMQKQAIVIPTQTISENNTLKRVITCTLNSVYYALQELKHSKRKKKLTLL